MNTAKKGRRLEHRSRAILEAAGYTVTRAAASKGRFDLIGISATDFLLIQVKCNAMPSPAEREAMAMVPVPANCRKLIHVFYDRQREPRVIEVGRC